MLESTAAPDRRRALALLFLRITIGLLLVWWGIDKFRDPAHGAKVAEKFYLGLGTGSAAVAAAGVLELLVGAAVILGVLRRFAYPAMIFVTAATAVGVWRSVLDPWGLWLEGTVVLFYPSIIVLAGAVVLWVFRSDDQLRVGAEAA